MALVRAAISNYDSFVALDQDGCLTWGFGLHRPEFRANVAHVQWTEYAFAYLRRDGVCTASGFSNFGGDSSVYYPLQYPL